MKILIKIISWILIKMKISELKVDEFRGYGSTSNSRFVYYSAGKWIAEEDLK